MKTNKTETKKPSTKKLALNRSALRKLAQDQLEAAAGATGCGYPGYCSTWHTCYPQPCCSGGCY
jgi:hypothetical protein